MRPVIGERDGFTIALGGVRTSLLAELVAGFGTDIVDVTEPREFIAATETETGERLSVTPSSSAVSRE